MEENASRLTTLQRHICFEEGQTRLFDLLQLNSNEECKKK